MRISDWSSDVCSSDLFADATTLNDYVQKDYVTLDANVTISSSNDRWRLSLVGNNLTDKIYVNQASGRPFRQAGVGDDLALTQNRGRQVFRSEEHTSELQSLMRISYAVFCLKKKITHKYYMIPNRSLSRLSYHQM